MTKPYTLALLFAAHGVPARKPSFIWFNPDEMRAESAYSEVPMPSPTSTAICASTRTRTS